MQFPIVDVRKKTFLQTQGFVVTMVIFSGLTDVASVWLFGDKITVPALCAHIEINTQAFSMTWYVGLETHATNKRARVMKHCWVCVQWYTYKDVHVLFPVFCFWDHVGFGSAWSSFKWFIFLLTVSPVLSECWKKKKLHIVESLPLHPQWGYSAGKYCDSKWMQRFHFDQNIQC